jgi:hypothetical protein
MGILAPGEDPILSSPAASMAVFAPGRRSTRGFPCLSHISVTLVEETLHMSAVYRNHDFMGRAYGNYLGLGRVLHFLSTESGYSVGELLCVSTHAAVEIGLGAGFGLGAIHALTLDCRRRLEAAA